MLRSSLSGLKPDRSRLLLILCALFLCAAMLYQLGSVPKGISLHEKTYITSAQSIDTIYHSPENAPHKLIILALDRTIKPGVTYLRIASVIFGLIFSFCFYSLCKNWFGRSVSLMGVGVFIISSFFLIPSRQVLPDILRFAPLFVSAVYYWHSRTAKKDLAWIILMLTAALCFYVPGMFWWLAIAIVVCRKQLLATAGRATQTAAAGGLLIFAVVIAPIVLAFVRDWHFMHKFLLIPSELPQPLDFIKYLGWSVSSIFTKTPYHDPLIIGRLPLLTIVQLALFIFGVYALFNAATKKAWGLSAAVALGIILAALNNDITLLFFSLPAIGIFMAGGLRYLYIEWRGIFPKNPIAKTLAISMLFLLISIQAVYGLTYSLVAWPAAQDTKSTYVLK